MNTTKRTQLTVRRRPRASATIRLPGRRAIRSSGPQGLLGTRKPRSGLILFGASLLALAGLPVGVTAQMADGDSEGTRGPDIVETAVAAGSFETLAAALEAAGLVETLKGEGPFTVFAPTDEAFARLPAGTLEGLLADREKLTAILTYHVVPGRVTSDQVVKLNSATTVNGQDVAIRVIDGAVKIDDATVIQADVAASNGVIHVIDTVILPSN